MAEVVFPAIRILAPRALPIQIAFSARILISDARRHILAHNVPGGGTLARVIMVFPTAF
jgi:hypothetical protein